MEKVAFSGHQNCYRLFNETVELIVTTDIGPRILRFAFLNRENIFGEVPADVIQTELGNWKPWGGHRLWAAPEARPGSYAPDNKPIEYEIVDDHTIRLIQAPDSDTLLGKEIKVSIDPVAAEVMVHHHITNKNRWPIEVAPWALTILHGGGEAIVPQEPYQTWEQNLAPARPLVLWHYTDLSDSRLTLGTKFIRLRTDEAKKTPQKIGMGNRQGWAAYLRQRTLFVKRFDYTDGETYPDYGSNTEVYTAGSFIELESLGYLRLLDPGESAEHLERWRLIENVESGDDKTIEEIVSKFSPV